MISAALAAIWRRFLDGDVWQRLSAVITVLALVVILATFRDYGVSWDDEYSRFHGADFLRWFASGFRDRSVLSHAGNEYLYGAAFHAPAAAFAFFSPLGPYESIHLLIALTGLAGGVVTFAIARRLADSRAGFFAVVILLLTPTYYGHWFINPKDLPFAVAHLGAVYMLIRFFDWLPRPTLRQVAATGIAVGMPLGIRVGGVFLFGYLGVLVLTWLVFQNLRDPAGKMRRDLPRIVAALFGVALVAWGVMVFWWPFAQLNPVANPLYALAKTTDFDGAGFMNLYGGSFVRSNMLPREYLPVLLLITLPEFYVVGLSFATFAAFAWVLRKSSRPAGSEAALCRMGFFVFVAAFPILAAVVVHPTVYDSTRLFLFVIPPLAIISAIGLSWFFKRSKSRGMGLVVGGILTFITIAVMRDMIRMHPYQYVYFNTMSGGLKRAAGSFDTEYWGTAHKAGIEWLSRNYKLDAPPNSIGVANASNPFLTAYYVRSGRDEVKRFRHADMRNKPQIVLAQTRWNLHLIHGGQVIHIVKRMGVPFLYVIESNSTGTAEDSVMKIAVERLYMRRDPLGAVPELQKVLRMNPSHHGAQVSLAVARQHSGGNAQSDQPLPVRAPDSRSKK